MRKSVTVLAGAVVLAMSHLVQAEPARDPESVRGTFMEVASRLDQGGDLFVVANVDGVLERTIQDLTDFVTAAAAGETDDEAKQAAAMAAKLNMFLKKNGFYAVNGLGMSVVPRTDGLSTMKVFVSRDSAAAALPLWRALVGGSPKELVSLTYLPADTEMARTGTADIKQLWAMIEQGVAEIAPAEGAAQFKQGVGMSAMMLGVPLSDLINSIGTDGAFSIQLSKESTISLPAGDAPVAIPTPSLLIVLETKDDALMQLIRRQAMQAKMPLMESQAEGVALYSANMPVPIFPVQLTIAQDGNFFLLGSTTKVVKDALAAQRSGKGLVATETFKKAFAGQPTKNNGIGYFSERFGKMIKDIQAQTLDMAPAANAQDAKMRALIRRILDRQPTYTGSFTIMNYETGIRSGGTTSASGHEFVLSAAAAPMGLMAAIAIPSFVKARETAQENACINNLRQIDSAKEQWALVESQVNGAAPDLPGVCEYIKGNTLPTCPQGGTYTVGNIGDEPSCSVHGSMSDAMP